MYSWGYGDMLALGHGKDKDEPTPRKLLFEEAKSNGRVAISQVMAMDREMLVLLDIWAEYVPYQTREADRRGQFHVRYFLAHTRFD